MLSAAGKVLHKADPFRSRRPDLRSVRNTLPNDLIVTIGGPEPSIPGDIHSMSNDGRSGSLGVGRRECANRHRTNCQTAKMIFVVGCMTKFLPRLGA